MAPHEVIVIPWGFILKQTINVLLLWALLTYLLKAKVKTFFKERAESFERLLVLAKKARDDAEQQKQDITARLAKLESTSRTAIDDAKHEAEELKEKIRAEAQSLAKQIRDDAQKTAQREIERAKLELRNEVVTTSLQQTREILKTTVKEQDQTRLQDEFVDKIQVIR